MSNVSVCSDVPKRSTVVATSVLHQLARKGDYIRQNWILNLRIRAPAEGWVTNLNVYTGSLFTAALVKQNLYKLAYMEETKLTAAEMPLGVTKVLKDRWC